MWLHWRNNIFNWKFNFKILSSWTEVGQSSTINYSAYFAYLVLCLQLPSVFWLPAKIDGFLHLAHVWRRVKNKVAMIFFYCFFCFFLIVIFIYFRTPGLRWTQSLKKNFFISRDFSIMLETEIIIKKHCFCEFCILWDV